MCDNDNVREIITASDDILEMFAPSWRQSATTHRVIGEISTTCNSAVRGQVGPQKET